MLNKDLWLSIYRGLIFSAIVVLLIEIPLGIALASALKGSGRLRKALVLLIAMPLLISATAIGANWLLLTRGAFAPLHNVLNRIGIPYDLSNPFYAFLTVIIMDVWHWTSFGFLVFYSVLSGQAPEPIESAMIDGASSWKIFRYITWPNLKFPILVVSLIRFMDAFKIYDEPWILTGGGPGLTTTFLSIHTVRLAVGYFNIGMASAVSLFYFYIIVLIAFVMLVLMTLGERRK